MYTNGSDGEGGLEAGGSSEGSSGASHGTSAWMERDHRVLRAVRGTCNAAVWSDLRSASREAIKTGRGKKKKKTRKKKKKRGKRMGEKKKKNGGREKKERRKRWEEKKKRASTKPPTRAAGEAQGEAAVRLPRSRSRAVTARCRPARSLKTTAVYFWSGNSRQKWRVKL